mmetsp:Transcript_30796/g.65192  ORF Transcript_30796/g.65192 Transcript_30796/m.65192 type:complete len:243 (-) Transcript_30796:268-996(-)
MCSDLQRHSDSSEAARRAMGLRRERSWDSSTTLNEWAWVPSSPHGDGVNEVGVSEEEWLLCDGFGIAHRKNTPSGDPTPKRHCSSPGPALAGYPAAADSRGNNVNNANDSDDDDEIASTVTIASPVGTPLASPTDKSHPGNVNGSGDFLMSDADRAEALRHYVEPWAWAKLRPALAFGGAGARLMYGSRSLCGPSKEAGENSGKLCAETSSGHWAEDIADCDCLVRLLRVHHQKICEQELEE